MATKNIKKAANKTGSKQPAKKSPGKKLAATKSAAKKAAIPATKKAAPRKTVSLNKNGRDPKGGLTAAGRKTYNDVTGGHLRPGVKGVADTPEKKQRKGSFLVRHFSNPPGPVVKMASRRGRRCKRLRGASRCRRPSPMRKSLRARAVSCWTKPETQKPNRRSTHLRSNFEIDMLGECGFRCCLSE